MTALAQPRRAIQEEVETLCRFLEVEGIPSTGRQLAAVCGASAQFGAGAERLENRGNPPPPKEGV